MDVPVWNAYEVVSRGKDQQLEAAVKALLERVRPRASGAASGEGAGAN
jgi:hypothetical protein